MTPEEIRNTIEQMLAVQRQIQESQIRNTDNIARLESKLRIPKIYFKSQLEVIEKILIF